MLNIITMADFMSNADISQPIIAPTTTRRRFVGQPVEDIKMTGEYLANKFRTNKLAYRNTLNAVKNIPVKDADKDTLNKNVDMLTSTMQEVVETGDWTNAEFKVMGASDNFFNNQQVKDIQAQKATYDAGITDILSNEKTNEIDKEIGGAMFATLNSEASQWDENGKLVNPTRNIYIPDDVDIMEFAKNILAEIEADTTQTGLTKVSDAYKFLQEAIKTRSHDKIYNAVTAIVGADDKLKSRFEWEAKRDAFKYQYVDAKGLANKDQFNKFIQDNVDSGRYKYDKAKGVYYTEEPTGKADSNGNPIMQRNETLNDVVQGALKEDNPALYASYIVNRGYNDNLIKFGDAIGKTGMYTEQIHTYMADEAALARLQATLAQNNWEKQQNYNKNPIGFYAMDSKAEVDATAFFEKDTKNMAPDELKDYKHQKIQMYQQMMMEDNDYKTALTDDYNRSKQVLNNFGIDITPDDYIDVLINGIDAKVLTDSKTLAKLNSNKLGNISAQTISNDIRLRGQTAITEYNTKTPITISSDKIYRFNNPIVMDELNSQVATMDNRITDGTQNLLQFMGNEKIPIGVDKSGTTLYIEYNKATKEQKQKVMETSFLAGVEGDVEISIVTETGKKTFRGSDTSGLVTGYGKRNMIAAIQTSVDKGDFFSANLQTRQAVNYLSSKYNGSTYDKIDASNVPMINNISLYGVDSNGQEGKIDGLTYIDIRNDVIPNNTVFVVNDPTSSNGMKTLTKEQITKNPQYDGFNHVFVKPTKVNIPYYDNNGKEKIREETRYKVAVDGQPTKAGLYEQTDVDFISPMIESQLKTQIYKEPKGGGGSGKSNKTTIKVQ